MSPLDPIDLYCERLGPELWAEPVNALSNASFLLAAWLIRRRVAERGAQPGDGQWIGLAALMACIGLGSLLFHTLALRWAAYFDSGFIALYMIAFACVWAHRVFALPWRHAAWAAPAYVAFIAAVTFGLTTLRLAWLPSDITLYISACMAMVAFVVLTRPRSPAAARWLLATLAVFVLSLTLRQIDLPLCPHWPLGTHFAWHLLNGAALYLSVRALMRVPAPATGPATMRPC